ncbi:hypothetical protein, partial [Acidovorax sp. HMWF029]|uniref:hypothetical protein n=1 Tax=Acidovorax sp. HMWF029 TaxID=2056863 RepID=UPI001E470714
SLLKFSAGQWNTLVNIGLALCGLAGQVCIGTNTDSVGPSILQSGCICSKTKARMFDAAAV